MTRTVTYSQLDRLLCALGFHLAPTKHPGQVYRRQESETIIVLAKHRPTDSVRNADLLSVRRHLVERGLLEADTFEEFASTGAIPVSK